MGNGTFKILSVQSPQWVTTTTRDPVATEAAGILAHYQQLSGDPIHVMPAENARKFEKSLSRYFDDKYTGEAFDQFKADFLEALGLNGYDVSFVNHQNDDNLFAPVSVDREKNITPKWTAQARTWIDGAVKGVNEYIAPEDKERVTGFAYLGVGKQKSPFVALRFEDGRIGVYSLYQWWNGNPGFGLEKLNR